MFVFKFERTSHRGCLCFYLVVQVGSPFILIGLDYHLELHGVTGFPNLLGDVVFCKHKKWIGINVNIKKKQV